MGTYPRPSLRASLVGLLCLLALSVALPQAHAALPLAAACVDGHALWANSATRAATLVIAGSNSAIGGAVRSNRALELSGSNNRISGALTFGSSFEDGGDANSYPPPAQAAPAAPPVSYTLADYRPGGVAAQAALQAGRYRSIAGDFDVPEPTTLSGLYYVAGNAKLGASDIRGDFTLVAEGTIDVSGSRLRAEPYADGLLLFAGRAAPGSAVIKLAGSNSDLRGVIYGPGGLVELSGSNNLLAGAVLGDTLSLSGSSLSIAFAPGFCPGGPPDDGGAAFAEGEVVLKLRDTADLAAVSAAYALDPAPIDQFGSRPIFRQRILDGAGPPLKAAQLGADPRVEYAEPNYLAQDPESRRGRGSWVLGAGPGAYVEQWAPALIRLPAAHAVSRGAGITVAVLDTGVDPGHPALAGRLTPGFDFVDFDADPREQGVYNLDAGFGHGTHVAGLVALAAPEARIMPVRVLDAAGVGNIWVLAEGLLFAAERGPDGQPLSGDEAQVINLSLGTLRPTRLLEDLVAELACAPAGEDDDDDEDETDQGVSGERCRRTGGAVVLAAAGNGGNAAPQYPAAEAVPGSLALGASTRGDTTAAFSSFGPWVRLAAPGEAIVSSVPGGGYGTWSGSSMAAPLAAGVAALVRSADPALAAPDVTERLVSSGRPIAGPIERRLDAAAALGVARIPETAGLPGVYLPLVASAR